MDQEKQAQQLVDGVEWLAQQGRDGAIILNRIMTDKSALGEALAWLQDIYDGTLGD